MSTAQNENHQAADSQDATKGGEVEKNSKGFDGWFDGPLKRDGSWVPKGEVELLIHSHISEDDGERDDWGDITDQEKREYRSLLLGSPAVALGSSDFADRVSKSISQRNGKKGRRH